MKTCRTCGKTLGPRNRIGYCVICGPKARGPEHGKLVSAGIRKRFAEDPVYADQLRSRARALSADPSLNARRCAHFNQAIRDKGNLASRSPESRKKAGRMISERRLAWCPRELRAEYLALVSKKGFKAAEARAMIEDHHAVAMDRWRRQIGQAPEPEPQPVPIDPRLDAVEQVAVATGLTREQIIGDRRLPHLVDARAIVAVSLRDSGLSYARIGEIMRRDHSSIVHLVDSFEARKAKRPNLARLLDHMSRALAA